MTIKANSDGKSIWELIRQEGFFVSSMGAGIAIILNDTYFLGISEYYDESQEDYDETYIHVQKKLEEFKSRGDIYYPDYYFKLKFSCGDCAEVEYHAKNSKMDIREFMKDKLGNLKKLCLEVDYELKDDDPIIKQVFEMIEDFY